MRFKHPSILPGLITLGIENYDYTWKTFGDQVLGGLSTAHIVQKDTSIKVTGFTINKHGKAFTCLRSQSLKHDLSNVIFIDIKIKTDGRPYAFELEYNHGWHEEKLGSMINTTAGQWHTVRVPMSSFNKVKFCEIIDSKYDPKILNNIYRFGFYVSDNIDGPYEFEVESIDFIY